MEVVDICGSWLAFIVFGSPVYQLGSAHIGAILFGRAGASEVSLLATGEAHTLYAPLGPSVISPDDVSSCLSSSSSSPISSQCPHSIYIHGHWLVVPSSWRGAGVVQGLAKALMALLQVVGVLREPRPWLGVGWM